MACRNGAATAARRPDRSARAAGIAVYELQGALHFASMEEVLRQIAGEIASISH